MDNTLHDLIQKLGEQRNEKKRLDYESREMGKQIAATEYALMDLMDDLQISETRTDAGKVILGEAVYPQVEDWDAVYQFIHDNEYYHCLEKRFAVLAYREILGQGNNVPGVVPYTKRKVTFKET
jgi:hypothetical protein